MYQMISGVPKGSWSKCAEILFPLSKDRDKKWGLRFYVFLTEILQKLGQEIQPFDPQTGKKSAFSLIYKKVQETNLTKQEYIYYDCDLDNLPELDKKFFSIFNIDGNTPSKVKTTTNRNNNQNSIVKEQEGLLEKVRLARKDFLNIVFNDKIDSDELLKSKEVYQQIVLRYFEKMEHQLEQQSENQNSIKEMELADNLFEIYDNVFVNDVYTPASVKSFRNKACSILIQIFGGYPEKYHQAISMLPAIQSPKKIQNLSKKKQSEVDKIQSLNDSKKYLVRNIHQRPKIQRNQIKERDQIRKQNNAQLLRNKNRQTSQTSINKQKVASVGHTKTLDEKKMINRLILKEYQEKEDQYTRMKEKYDSLRRQYEERCYQEYYNNQGKKEEVDKIFNIHRTQRKLRNCYSTKKLRY